MKHPTTRIAALLAGAAAAGVSVSASGAGEADPLARFNWLAGHWCQQTPDGRLIEEHWLPALGGMLMSVGRTTSAGKTHSFEFLRLELLDGTPTLVAQPDGRPPVAFPTTASGDDWVRFENPAHDFPKRVEYRRTATGGLHAEIGGPGKDGGERVIPFDYVPCIG